MTNVWKSLPKSFLALAPMEDVTDTVFRRMVARCARPDIFFTEFTNSDGLLSVGKGIVSQRLQYTNVEHPIIAQLWGGHPDSFYEAAKMVVSLGFDGLDINFGCPERVVVKTGCGAATIDNLALAGEIITAVKSGIKDSKKAIPVSVKTRIGYKTISDEWIPFLLEQQLDALTIHGRTATQMSDPPVHWDFIEKAVLLRNQSKATTLIIGNGDIMNASEAMETCARYGLDGMMMGRAIFHDLWAFDRSSDKHVPTTSELIRLCIDHLKLFEITWGDEKHYPIMKKYFKIYIHGFDGASEIRTKLMETRNISDALRLLHHYCKLID